MMILIEIVILLVIKNTSSPQISQLGVNVFPSTVYRAVSSLQDWLGQNRPVESVGWLWRRWNERWRPQSPASIYSAQHAHTWTQQALFGSRNFSQFCHVSFTYNRNIRVFFAGILQLPSMMKLVLGNAVPCYSQRYKLLDICTKGCHWNQKNI